MLSTIIAIILALATGTTPAQPAKQDPAKDKTEEGKGKDKSTTTDPATMSTFGGTGQWTEG
ncbi:hypothetical protein [uncultured Pontibacter sp.]|uniref:hypothetical protein n=1 Tax=uncultured Pontibacter sp. TaxID=453356 RepID=UPI0026331035|nr:hypothetical protein [uncultured Pontibacter sp.]